MVYLDEQTIRQLYDAFNQRNFEVVIKLYSEGISLHCPGRNKISGEYQGRQDVLNFWQKQVEVSEGSFQARVIDVAESDEHLVVITEVNVQRGSKSYQWRRILHFLIYDSRAQECWIYEGDQYKADEAFA